MTGLPEQAGQSLKPAGAPQRTKSSLASHVARVPPAGAQLAPCGTNVLQVRDLRPLPLQDGEGRLKLPAGRAGEPDRGSGKEPEKAERLRATPIT